MFQVKLRWQFSRMLSVPPVTPLAPMLGGLHANYDAALAQSFDRYDRFDWWRTRRWRSGLLVRHDSNPCNHYTAAPLVINQAQLDWPCQEGFSLQVNRRTQARKDKHTIWNCKYVWSKNEYGVQALNIKGLIATMVYNKNGGPNSQQKDLVS
jgi:hypothetical protein